MIKNLNRYLPFAQALWIEFVCNACKRLPHYPAPTQQHDVQPAFYHLQNIQRKMNEILWSLIRFYLRKFYILFRSKSSMHLFIWAIHSCFSVLVAAYTANDLVAVRMSHPFRYSNMELSNEFLFSIWIWMRLVYCYSRPLSSSPCNCTSSNGIMCCLLYFFLLITMLPYTRISLNRKNCLAFGRLRHIFVRTPSPTKTRPWIFSGYICQLNKNSL